MEKKLYDYFNLFNNVFNIGGSVVICPEDGKDAFFSLDELQAVYETAKQMKDYKRQ